MGAFNRGGFSGYAFNEKSSHSYASVEGVPVTYPESTLWNELKTYAQALLGQDNNIQQCKKELRGNTAEAVWLDYWMAAHFGILRQGEESDLQYFTRAKYEILALRANNWALVKLVKDAIGMDVTIGDAYAEEAVEGNIGRFFLGFKVPVDMSPADVTKLVDKVKGVITRSRSAGTYFKEQAFKTRLADSIEPQPIIETYFITARITKNESYQPGYIQVGAKWKVGTPGLKVGMNAAVKEQVQVRVRTVATNQITRTIYGG